MEYVNALGGYLKQHRRKVVFISIAAAVGYAGYRGYMALNAEIEQLKQRLTSGKNAAMLGPDAPKELLAAKLELLFVQAQMSSDGALSSFLSALQPRLNNIIPSLSAAKLKERIAQCKTTEEKAAVFEEKNRSVFALTAAAIYAVACSEVAVKVTYAVAAAMMVDAEDPSEIASAAEETVSRITQRLIGSQEGLQSLCARVGSCVDSCLQQWNIKKPCKYEDYVDLWRNIRQHMEDLSFEISPSMVLSPAEAARRSVLSYTFPFSADGVAANAFSARVDAALSGERALDALNSVLNGMFQHYFDQVKGKFEGGAALPLVRIVPLVQVEIVAIMRSSETNTYIANAVLNNMDLMYFLKEVSGVANQNGGLLAAPQSKRILFVCTDNMRDSVIASDLAKMYGRANNIEVYSAAASWDVPVLEQQQQQQQQVQHVPRGLKSIPRDIVFDVLVLLGQLDADAASGVPAKRRVRWPTPPVSSDGGDEQGLLALQQALDVRVRALLVELASER